MSTTTSSIVVLSRRDIVLVNATGGLLLYDSWNPTASSTYSIPGIFPRALADDPIERKAAYTELAVRTLHSLYGLDK